jgi:hypothetical protein
MRDYGAQKIWEIDDVPFDGLLFSSDDWSHRRPGFHFKGD